MPRRAASKSTVAAANSRSDSRVSGRRLSGSAPPCNGKKRRQRGGDTQDSRSVGGASSKFQALGADLVANLAQISPTNEFYSATLGEPCRPSPDRFHVEKRPTIDGEWSPSPPPSERRFFDHRGMLPASSRTHPMLSASANTSASAVRPGVARLCQAPAPALAREPARVGSI